MTWYEAFRWDGKRVRWTLAALLDVVADRQGVAKAHRRKPMGPNWWEEEGYV